MTVNLRPRDFAGYGATPPAFSWPDEARLALDIIINYEEGAERNPLDGDARIDEMSDIGPIPTASGERQLLIESSYEYGSRVGVWRVLELLDAYRINATVFASGRALERTPAVSQAFRDRGYDFVGHGYRWVPHGPLDSEELRADVRDAIQSIEQMGGQRISGWFTRGPQSIETRPILAQEGFLFDSDDFNDDIPYFADVQDRPFLVVPYSLTSNDWMYWAGSFKTADDFGTFVGDTFDALYNESAKTPRMMSVGLHPRIIGLPGRIRGLERFLEHVREHDGIWMPGRSRIATFWAESFAPPKLWNWEPGQAAARS